MEKKVQYHIRAKLKLPYHGQKLEKLVSRCPYNTKHNTSERHKYFEKIQQHIDRNIENMVNTKNDHSAPYNKTCLQTVKIRYKGGAESSETKGGCSETLPPSLPAHHPRSQSSQLKNTTEQKATKTQQDKMPSDRMTAIKEV